MRRDFTQPILDLSGQKIQENGKDVTLCTVALSALMTPTPEDAQLSGKDKADRFALAMRINNNPAKVDITAGQMDMLKTLIGRCFGPLAVGRAYELLEQEPKLAVAEPCPAEPA